MSLKTWIEEFYPVDAVKATSSEAEALAHVKRKWKGLRSENLEKHGVKLGDDTHEKHVVIDLDDHSATFANGNKTCALCQRHKHKEVACPFCILQLVHGASCFRSNNGIDPYGALLKDGDPEPMLRLIERAEERLKEECLEKQE